MRVFLQFTRNTINNKKHLITICDLNNIPKSNFGIIFNQHAEFLKIMKISRPKRSFDTGKSRCIRTWQIKRKKWKNGLKNQQCECQI